MINRISKIASMALILIMAFTMAIGCKTSEPEEEASVETAEEEVTEEEVEEEAAPDSDAGKAKPAWLVEDTDDHITVIDNAGNEVTIPKPVRSLIALDMGTVYSTLRAIKAEGTVVASNEYVTRNKAFFPVLSTLPCFGTQGQVDNEKIVELKPDVIFCTPSFYSLLHDTIIDEFPVVQIETNTIEDIRMLGAIVDKEEETDEYVKWITGYTDIIDQRVSTLKEEDLQGVFVYYGGEYGMAPPPPYGTFGKDNCRNPLIKRAGGRSLSENIPGDWITVDAEWVLTQDPPLIIRNVYIISDWPEMGYSVTDLSGAKTLMENIIHQPAFEGSNAVRNENVYMIYGDLFTDCWFVALTYLAVWLQPELFGDLDPVEMHQEFITRFQGLNYDVQEQGVFSYSLKQHLLNQ